MDPKLVQRRRQLFWEIFCTDQWKVGERMNFSLDSFSDKSRLIYQSLGAGRPPSFHLDVIDTEFAEDKDATVDNEGNTVPSSPSYPAFMLTV